jgi:phosphatidylinositol 4-kinase A
VPALVDIIRDIPYIDFDQCLSWEGTLQGRDVGYYLTNSAIDWALPDQLSYTAVAALLRLGSAHETYRAVATESVFKFAASLVANMKEGNCECLP